MDGWPWVDRVPKELVEGRKKEGMDAAPTPE